MSDSRRTRPISVLTGIRRLPEDMAYAELGPTLDDMLRTARKDTDNLNNTSKMRKHRSTNDTDSTSFATLGRDLMSQLPDSPVEPKNTATTSSSLGYMRYSSIIYAPLLSY